MIFFPDREIDVSIRVFLLIQIHLCRLHSYYITDSYK